MTGFWKLVSVNEKAVSTVQRAFGLREESVEFCKLAKRTYVFFLLRTLLAIISVRNAYPSADHATSRVRAVVALVAHTHQSSRPYVRVANNALAVT